MTQAKKYVASLLDQVTAREGHQKEFIQALKGFLASIEPVLAKNPTYMERNIVELLIEPERLIQFRIPWTDDKGSVHVNRGYRVQFNSALGPYKGGMRFHTGTESSQNLHVAFAYADAKAMGLQDNDNKNIQVTTMDKAKAAMQLIDNSLNHALNQLTTIGAIQSRLEYTAMNLTTAHENTTSAESTIRDADMAKEMTEYTKNNVLMQSAQSMLSQANQNSSAALSLLQ